MKHDSYITRLASKLLGIKLPVRENLYYETMKSSVDFADDDLPNWRAVKAIAGETVAPIVTPITSGQSNPATIAHTGMTYPTVLAYKADGSQYTGYTYVDDGTNIVITGNPDSNGNFADSFTVVVKP